ncbi:MAG: flagellar biosynthesis protein FliQ [Candidatus Scalinduaceae bacterium]
MGQDIVAALGRETIEITMSIIAPLIGTALVVGLLIGIFQAATSIQEQTLTFLPKLLAVFGVFIITMPWLIQKLMTFTSALLGNLFSYSY